MSAVPATGRVPSEVPRHTPNPKKLFRDLLSRGSAHRSPDDASYEVMLHIRGPGDPQTTPRGPQDRPRAL